MAKISCFVMVACAVLLAGSLGGPSPSAAATVDSIDAVWNLARAVSLKPKPKVCSNSISQILCDIEDLCKLACDILTCGTGTCVAPELGLPEECFCEGKSS